MMLPNVPIFLCTEPVDMRRAFRGLSKHVSEVLDADPRGGALFCFYNKRRKSVTLCLLTIELRQLQRPLIL